MNTVPKWAVLRAASTLKLRLSAGESMSSADQIYIIYLIHFGLVYPKCLMQFVSSTLRSKFVQLVYFAYAFSPSSTAFIREQTDNHLHNTLRHVWKKVRDKPLKMAFRSSGKPQKLIKTHQMSIFQTWLYFFLVFEGILLFNFQSKFNTIQTLILRLGDLWLAQLFQIPSRI